MTDHDLDRLLLVEKKLRLLTEERLGSLEHRLATLESRAAPSHGEPVMTIWHWRCPRCGAELSDLHETCIGVCAVRCRSAHERLKAAIPPGSRGGLMRGVCKSCELLTVVL